MSGNLYYVSGGDIRVQYTDGCIMVWHVEPACDSVTKRKNPWSDGEESEDGDETE